MTKEEFKNLCNKTVLLDGATGSYLMAAGMPKGTSSELWIMEHPEVLIQLQKDYVAAGSQIIYAPTFGANRVNLAKHKSADDIIRINETLISYSKEAVGQSAYIAGDITTSGEMMEPYGDFTYEDAYALYKEQISILAGGGVDMIVAETMFSIDEILAALDAANSVCTLPVMCSLTVEADGSIFTGGNVIDASLALEAAGADAVGINCSVGPDQLEAVVRSIRKSVNIPVIAKPNAGMPQISASGLAVYDMNSDDFALHLMTLVDAGATLIGGCCGTTPEYIQKIAAQLGS
ncbi:MAG: homocysteine S-methyltransferase family protein [Lachnospiraceae bacterium]